MLHSAKKLDGVSLHALDGDIGRVRDFYFDDLHWQVRYLVVETGAWLLSRKALIAPEAITATPLESDTISVNLTKDQVRHSPPTDSDEPVSRQHEVMLRNYYGWPGYWNGVFAERGMVAPILAPMPPVASSQAGLAADTHRPEPRGDTHLRSADEVRGYDLQASDGYLGHVDDLLIDCETWRVRYLIVDTRNWWPGKKVLVAPDWIRGIDWAQSDVTVELSRARVKSSPAYDPDAPWTGDYADRLHDHYERPRHSETESAQRS